MAVKTVHDGSMYTGLNRNSVVKVTTITWTVITLRKTIVGTMGYKNHLSCWRSSPCARCSRRMSERSAARVLVNASALPTKFEATKYWYVVIPPVTPTPNGLKTQG